MNEFIEVIKDLTTNTLFLMVILFAMATVQIFMRPLKNHRSAHYVVSIASAIFYLTLLFLAIQYAPRALQYF